MYNSNCLCKLWIGFTTKENKVKLLFYQHHCPLSPVPSAVLIWWLIWPRWVCLGWEVWWGAVYSYIFVPPFFFLKFFSMFLSLKANLILYAKWKESDYKIRSLGLERVGKWTTCPTTHTLFHCKPREVISHFNTLLPSTCCNRKVNEGLWSLKLFLYPPQHKFLTVIVEKK